MDTQWEAVIGLEVHVQLRTRSKLFCGCANAYGGEPNTRTCPVCLGYPGTLPTLNDGAVKAALALGLALGARINAVSGFDRKQYFYPDLPKGYQITQARIPFAEGGAIEIPGDPAVRGSDAPIRAGIVRAHLEEDAGKSLHEGAWTYVDLNRAGVPLVEVVGAPDLRSPQEASDWFKALHQLVTYLGICDGNLEEGSLRCDANLSLRPRGSETFGTRVEIKNLNSFRFLRQALEYEIQRQRALLEAGEPVLRETRGWDEKVGETRAQRSKEAAMDYRYFPEPDLPPLVITPEEREGVRASLPELPAARAARYRTVAGLGPDEAATLLQTRAFADFYDEVAERSGQPRAAAHWMLGEVSRLLNQRGTDLQGLGLRAEDLALLVRRVTEGVVAHTAAKDVLLPALLVGEGGVDELIERKGLAQVSDPAAVRSVVEAVLAAHPDQTAALRAGQTKLRGFLVGQVLKAGQGRLNPAAVNAALDALLAEGPHG